MVTEWIDWAGCYDESWKGLIVDEAFAHPAKAARGLIRRIFEHMQSQGWLPPRSRVLDVFGGIGTTAIQGTSMGHEVVCCELEERFVKLAIENFRLHRRTWEACGDPLPVILHGDSRKAAELVRGHFAACVGSPPFCDGSMGDSRQHGGMKTPIPHAGKAPPGIAHYGQSPGQSGSLKEGDFDAAVGSPPYDGKPLEGGTANRREGNVLTKWCEANGRNADSASRKQLYDRYGTTEGNIGNTQGETFWTAARDILLQVYGLLREGGYAAWIVKDYVKAGKRVPFCDNWAKLCEACGFEVIQRARCWLVKETTNPGLFGDVTKKTERKSFFRRLHERKPGAVRIDFEEVIFVRKR